MRETISFLSDDGDRLIAGYFTFVFSDYFAHLIGGSFEKASVFALMKTAGWDDEFKETTATIIETYNRLVHSKASSIDAISKGCEAWFNDPAAPQFERLAELFTNYRKHWDGVS